MKNKILYILTFLIIFSNCTGVLELEKPKNLAVSINGENNKLTIKWDPVESATSFSIQHYLNDIGYSNLGTSESNTFVITLSKIYDTQWIINTSPQEYYIKIRVKAENDTESSEWSDEAAKILTINIKTDTSTVTRGFETIDLGGGSYKYKIYLENKSNVCLDFIKLWWAADGNSSGGGTRDLNQIIPANSKFMFETITVTPSTPPDISTVIAFPSAISFSTCKI